MGKARREAGAMTNPRRHRTAPRRRYDVPPDNNRSMAAWLKQKLDAIYEEEWRAANEYWENTPPRGHSTDIQAYLEKEASRLARDHGNIEPLRALYPELARNDLLKKPKRPEGLRFHPNKFREVMKEVWGNITVARVVQDAARIRKLWLDHFGWDNRRRGYWEAERLAAERRIAEEHLPRARAHRLEARAVQLRKELIKVGVPKDDLRQIFQIVDPNPATTSEDETPAPPFIPI